MTHAIRFHKTGGPEVLVWEEVNLGKPGAGEARIRHTAVGLNFVDIYNRSGVYPLPLPSGLGGEGAGVVEEVGPGVTDLKPGDRVAYGAAPLGAYAEARLIPVDRLLKLPEGIDDKTAAAMMLKGLTVQYLIRQTYRVKPGDTILLHAAAGGVGLILSQWAKYLGATVIGTTYHYQVTSNTTDGYISEPSNDVTIVRQHASAPPNPDTFVVPTPVPIK